MTPSSTTQHPPASAVSYGRWNPERQGSPGRKASTAVPTSRHSGSQDASPAHLTQPFLTRCYLWRASLAQALPRCQGTDSEGAPDAQRPTALFPNLKNRGGAGMLSTKPSPLWLGGGAGIWDGKDRSQPGLSECGISSACSRPACAWRGPGGRQLWAPGSGGATELLWVGRVLRPR